MGDPEGFHQPIERVLAGGICSSRPHRRSKWLFSYDLPAGNTCADCCLVVQLTPVLLVPPSRWTLLLRRNHNAHSERHVLTRFGCVGHTINVEGTVFQPPVLFGRVVVILTSFCLDALTERVRSYISPFWLPSLQSHLCSTLDCICLRPIK